MNHFRHGARLLFKQPGFATAAILTLAIGIGATTGIFTFVDALLLRPLPYPDPGKLVMVYEEGFDSSRNNVSPANWLDWQEQTDAFDGLGAWDTGSGALTGEGEPETLRAQRVSHEFFETLGVQPLLGRSFTPDDDRSGAAPVVMLSHSLWQRRFGGDESVIGKSIRINETPCRVIGIMPAGFYLAVRNVDYWAPYALSRTRDWRVNAGRFINVVGRVKADRSLEEAQAQLTAVAARLEQEHPEFNKNTSANVVPLREVLAGDVKTSLQALLAAVAALLLIGCFNVSNLLLARTATRRQEIAVRTALGAKRTTIVRQLLAENLLLAVGGCALGLLLARWMVDGLFRLLPPGLVQLGDIPLDPRVLAFSIVVSLGASLLCSLAPAFVAASQAPIAVTQDGSRSVTRGFGHFRKGFTVAQVALTVTLCIGAGLLLRSFLSLQAIDAGIDPRNLLTVRVDLPGARYDPRQRVEFFQQALDRIATIPGVDEVSGANSLPVTGFPAGTHVDVRGMPALPQGEYRIARVGSVAPGYFQTLRTPLLRGRDFTWDDLREGAAPTFIVNQAFVDRLLDSEEALGRQISVWMEDENPYGRIIGVVGSWSQDSPQQPADPMVFYPYSNLTYRGFSVAIRTNDQATAAAGAAKIVQELDPNQPITRVRSLDEVLAETIARERMSAVIVVGFAASALLLASIGIYGVLSRLVAERTREIGVRMALGAPSWSLSRMMLLQGVTPAGAGMLLGLGLALVTSQLIESQLYQTAPKDPLTYGFVSVVTAAVVLIATWIPARRAMRVDPQVALRAD